MLQDIPTFEQWEAASDRQRRLWRAKRWTVNSRLMPGYPLGEPCYEELAYGPQELTTADNAPVFGKVTDLEPIRKRNATKRKKAA